MRQSNTGCVHFARGAENDYCTKYFPHLLICVDCDTCSSYELRPARLNINQGETLKHPQEHGK